MIVRNGRPVIGFGQAEAVVVPAATSSKSPWTIPIVTSVIGAASTWLLDELVDSARRKRKRKR